MLSTILAWIRTLLFVVIFYGLSLPLVVVALLLVPLGGGPIAVMGRAWSRWHRLCARWLLGQRVQIEGDLPQGAFFCVLKHEAMFETIDLLSIFDRPVIAAKRELTELPLWGRAARAYGIVPVDREGGASALRTLRIGARAALGAGRPFCLFPEGTRIAHGERPPLKSGFAGLYALLKMPVVPIAIDSGRLNRRGHFIRLPGVVRYRIGETIPPGLPRKEVEARVHVAINALND